MAHIMLIKSTATPTPYDLPPFTAVVGGDDFSTEDATALKQFCTGEAIVLVINSAHTVEFR